LSYSAAARAELETFLHAHIPLTKLMSLRVEVDEVHGFAIAAPLSANSNHLGTAFGGSINAVATIAAYSKIWLELHDQTPREVVVAESSIRFLRPIREIIRATCDSLATSEIESLHAGRARVHIAVTIWDGVSSDPAARFTGAFLATSP
jgi:thioesterase domain-containing protein